MIIWLTEVSTMVNCTFTTLSLILLQIKMLHLINIKMHCGELLVAINECRYDYRVDYSLDIGLCFSSEYLSD